MMYKISRKLICIYIYLVWVCLCYCNLMRVCVCHCHMLRWYERQNEVALYAIKIGLLQRERQIKLKFSKILIFANIF